MDWCVYMIECASGAYYTGSTPDLEKRFRLHQAGKGARYTRMDKPRRIVAVEACVSRSEALKLEAALKRLPRPAKTAWIKQHAYRPERRQLKVG
jgi:putative endonuclease